MTVRLHLNGNIREATGFNIISYMDDSAEQMTFNGTRVSEERGRLCMAWDINFVIPEELKAFVEGISCYEIIPVTARRESGIYRHESAECELTPGDSGNGIKEGLVYNLKVTAMSLEDIKMILHKIKTGVIRPDESYENRQVGKTRQQLESELMQTQQLLGEAWATIDVLHQLAGSIEKETLPVTFCSRVAKRIGAIFGVRR